MSLRKLRIPITVAGVIVATFGFYADKATSFPTVLSVLSPTYASAKRAVEKLERQRALARIVASQMTVTGGAAPPELLERFELGTAMMTFGQTHVGEHVPFNVFARGQSKGVSADFGVVKSLLDSQTHTSYRRDDARSLCAPARQAHALMT